MGELERWAIVTDSNKQSKSVSQRDEGSFPLYSYISTLALPKREREEQQEASDGGREGERRRHRGNAKSSGEEAQLGCGRIRDFQVRLIDVEIQSANGDEAARK